MLLFRHAFNLARPSCHDHLAAATESRKDDLSLFFSREKERRNPRKQIVMLDDDDACVTGKEERKDVQ